MLYIKRIFEKADQKTIKACYLNISKLIGQKTELSEERKKQILIELYGLLK